MFVLLQNLICRMASIKKLEKQLYGNINCNEAARFALNALANVCITLVGDNLALKLKALNVQLTILLESI